MTHTPGPWRMRDIVIRGDFDIGIIAEETGNVSLIAEVYEVVNQSGRKTDVKANARLIAAAPDLATVAQGLIDFENTALIDDHVPLELIEKAKQAISLVRE